jgi:hypothetical protein
LVSIFRSLGFSSSNYGDPSKKEGVVKITSVTSNNNCKLAKHIAKQSNNKGTLLEKQRKNMRNL